MKYLSTRNNKLEKSFTDILFKGLSEDGGLFLPRDWPNISLEDLRGRSYQEIAHYVIKPYLGNEISNKELSLIIDKTYKNFKHDKIAPLVHITDNKYILELFYGPTLAFKDYALQFLANLFSHFLEIKKTKITVIGATSGDTGSAAIDSFKGKEGIEVFILHPFNKISEVQRRQMTTIRDKNIHNLAIKGTFDDCQKIVKNLFSNSEIKSNTSLIAVNSINWARLIAQSVYYFWAYMQLNEKKINFIVPSGNFGNVFSARVSKHMGLPVNKLHIVTNANDILNRIINTGVMKINEVKQTYSPSMDIQISSNFERQLFESYNMDSNKINKMMESFNLTGSQELGSDALKHLKSIYSSYSVSDEETLATIKKFKNDYDYLSDPHTATGLSVLSKIKDDYPIVSLACAHPAKFSDAIKKATGILPHLPIELENIFDKEENITILENSIEKTKDYILQYL